MLSIRIFEHSKGNEKQKQIKDIGFTIGGVIENVDIETVVEYIQDIAAKLNEIGSVEECQLDIRVEK